MPKSKLSAFLSLLLVFLSGSLVGAFAYRLYVLKTVIATTGSPGGRRPDPEEVLKQRLAEMRDRIKVDDLQLAQIKEIYGQTREQFDQLHQRMSAEGRTIDQNQVAKITAILHPDQVVLYDQLRAEHEAQRQLRMKQHQDNDRKDRK